MKRKLILLVMLLLTAMIISGCDLSSIIPPISENPELTSEEIELIREYGYDSEYTVRWPDGYVDVYDATNYSQMQKVLNEWNSAIGGPVVFLLSSNPNSPVKVYFKSIPEYCGDDDVKWNEEDYTLSRVDLQISSDNAFSSSCGYPGSTHSLYLSMFKSAAGFAGWTTKDIPYEEWTNFTTINDTMEKMVKALHKVPPGYCLLPEPTETTYFLEGSLHCPGSPHPPPGGYPCDSCSTQHKPGYFGGFNVLTTDENCYVKLIYDNGAYIGNQNNCEVTIKGEKWLGLENEAGTELLVEQINKGIFDFKPVDKFVKRTMIIPGDGYNYEFANNGKEFRLYLSRDRVEAFKAVPWEKNMVIEIKNKETNKVFKYTFKKGIFPLAYSWSNGVANYGQCVWWAAKRWVEEVDPVTLFPFYPPSTEMNNVKKIDKNYQPKRFDVLINYDPNIPIPKPEHYGFVEKVDRKQVYITQFNWNDEVYNYIIRTWNKNATNLFYSNNFYEEYYFKYYYRGDYV